MKQGSVPTWAISFADLCMLLLGFFVILHVQSGQQAQVVNGIKQAFGGKPAPAAEAHEITPASLFEPGEALLRPEARAAMAAIGRRAAASHAHVRIESIGTDPAVRRFDGWELAAARTAAIGRAIQLGGLSDRAITISIPAMEGADGKARQRISIEVLAR